VLVAAIQLHCRYGGSRAAAHPLLQRNHLRHVGHGYAFAADPGQDAAHAMAPMTSIKLNARQP